MTAIDCPGCGLANPATAEHCDCGQDLREIAAVVSGPALGGVGEVPAEGVRTRTLVQSLLAIAVGVPLILFAGIMRFLVAGAIGLFVAVLVRTALGLSGPAPIALVAFFTMVAMNVLWNRVGYSRGRRGAPQSTARTTTEWYYKNKDVLEPQATTGARASTATWTADRPGLLMATWVSAKNSIGRAPRLVQVLVLGIVVLNALWLVILVWPRR